MTHVCDIYSVPGEMLSCSIPDISASADDGPVDVSVQMQGETVYAADLMPYASSVRIYDLRQIVESWMEARLRPQASCRVCIGQSSAVFGVLYCAADSDADGFRDSSFLTATAVQQLHRSASVVLSSVKTQQQITAAVRTMSDAVRGIEMPVHFSDANSVTVSLDDVCRAAACSLAPDDIAAVRFDCGRRSKTVYFSDDEPDVSLLFVNQYMCPDQLQLKATVTASRSVESSVAATSRSLTRYDIDSYRSYKIKAYGLTRQEAEALEQAAASVSLFINCAEGSGEAIVTECDLDFDNDPDKPAEASLSFRFAARRPMLQPWQLQQMLSGAYGIFTNHFTREFC